MRFIVRLFMLIGPIILGAYIAIVTTELSPRTKIFIWGVCALISIAAVMDLIWDQIQEKKKKRAEEELEKARNYDRTTIESSWLHNRGLSQHNINGLGENPKLYYHFDRVQKLERENKFLEAIEEYKKCLNHPGASIKNKVKSHIHIGNDYFQVLKYQDAIEHYIVALNLTKLIKERIGNLLLKGIAIGNIGSVYEELNKSKKAQKKYKKALAIFEKVLGLKPDQAYAWVNKGFSLKNLDRLEEALFAFGKALELKPDFFYAWYQKGFALLNLDRNKEALSVFDKVLELDSDNADSWSNRGVALGKIGCFEKAISMFDRALELKPDQVSAWVNKGFALLNIERYEESLFAYEKALELQPDQANEWYKKGFILLKLNRQEEALAAFEKVLELKPEDAGAWISRGVALGNLNRQEEALAAFDKALELEPECAYAWCKKAVVLGELERHEEALVAFEKAIKLNQDDADFWINKGIELGKLERYEEALFAYDKGLELKPNHADAWVNKGFTLLKLKRFAEVLELKSDDTHTHYNKACALALLGRKNDSFGSLRKAIELDENLKKIAREDEDFKALWEDPEFKKITS